jgi:hypothetical protein
VPPARDASHLCGAEHGIGEQLEDELGAGGVERVVGEWELLGAGDVDVGARDASAAGGGEDRLRRRALALLGLFVLDDGRRLR